MTAQTLPEQELAEFSLLSKAARQQLDDSVSAAQGNIADVRHELESQLSALDAHSTDQDMTPQAYQGDRAFLLGQIAYLDALQRVEQERQAPQHDSFLSRFTSIWHKRESADSR